MRDSRRAEAAGHRRGDRLARGARACSASSGSTRRAVDRTLGSVLKYERGPGGRSARPASSSSCAAVTDARPSASRRSSSTCRRWSARSAAPARRRGAGHAGAARPTSRARSTLVRPVARRRLYWTARGVFVTDQAQVHGVRPVFSSVFGDRGEATTRRSTRRRRADDRGAEPSVGDGAPATRHVGARATTTAAEVEVPVAMASDEERLADEELRRARAARARAALPADDAAAARRRRCAARAATSAAATASRSTCGARCAAACAPAATRSASRAGAAASCRAGS